VSKQYSELLRDPRWQKRRLEVFQRDGWKCTFCESKDKPLHVHHLRYSGAPWDSPESDLETLCCDCHDLKTRFDAAFGENNFSTRFCIMTFWTLEFAIQRDTDLIVKRFYEMFGKLFEELREKNEAQKLKKP